MMRIHKFIIACGDGDITRVSTLLPLVDPSDYDNWAIRVASHNGQLDIVRLLLEDSRVDPSVLQNLAIQLASENGHTEVVRLLTEHQFRLDGPEYTRNII